MNNNIIKIALNRTRTDYFTDSFYRNDNNDISICQEFVQDIFNITSDHITISANVNNPCEEGWKKIEIGEYGKEIIIAGEESNIYAHTRLRNYLKNINFPFTFYVKIEENNV